MLPNNLDVMHIKKNGCDNLIGILLGIARKINDNLKTILDMKAMGIRTSLHPMGKRKKMILPLVFHPLSKDQSVNSYNSWNSQVDIYPIYHVAWRFGQKIIVGLKSHDYQVLMQWILTVAIKGLLPTHTCMVLIYMSNTCRVLCYKELRLSDI